MYFHLKTCCLGYEQNSIYEKFVITFTQGFQKSKKSAHWTLGSGGKRQLRGVRNTNKKNPAQEGKIRPEKNLFLHGDFTPFIILLFIIIWDHFLPLFFLKDS